MKKFLFPRFLLLLLFLPGWAAAQPGFITDSLQVYIEREMKRWTVPGLTITIIQDGKVAVMKGFGITDLDTKKPVDENTLFRIGSCTKAFTATATAMLQEDKKLSLDGKVTEYLPSFSLNDPCITQQVIVRDLMCHRMGFRTFQGDFVNWNSNLTSEEVIDNLRNLEPPFPFRTTWGYNNAGFVAAGEIIRKISGSPWDVFLKNRVFDPLQMSRTSATTAAITADQNAARAYTMVNDQLTRIDYDHIDNLGASASINSSARDMANWILMLLQNGKFLEKEVVPAKALSETFKSHSITGDSYSKLFPSRHFQNYGLGWALFDYGGKRIISHNGGIYGFVTNVTIIPELNCGWFVSTNTDQNSLYTAIQYQLLDALTGQPYKNYSDVFFANKAKGEEEERQQRASWKEATAKKNPPPLPLKSFAGDYVNKAYGKITLEEKKNQLLIRFSRHAMTATLEHLADGNFLCTYSDPEFGVVEVPFTLANGEVSGLTLSCNTFIDYMSYVFEKMK
jgi:CubicO group peptidase (beta-lactamase class C family)